MKKQLILLSSFMILFALTINTVTAQIPETAETTPTSTETNETPSDVVINETGENESCQNKKYRKKKYRQKTRKGARTCGVKPAKARRTCGVGTARKDVRRVNYKKAKMNAKRIHNSTGISKRKKMMKKTNISRKS